MAGSGLLALLDDITTLLDDVAAISKAAAGKTAGISGDDLAVNSHVIVGVDPSRELPIVWAVAKGSFKNKGYLIPGALILNFILPAAITPLLMLGGAYLCYEGMEKTLHSLHGAESGKHHRNLTAAAIKSPQALYEFEKNKIKGAINTDLILSAEIIAVTLGTVAAEPFIVQLSVLGAIGVVLTAGIYGLVAVIVKLDDLGLHLAETPGNGPPVKILRALGNGLVQAAPKIMRFLAVAGTAAMLLVGGELILHGIPGAESGVHALAQLVSARGWLQSVAGMAAALITGVAAGLMAIPVLKVMAVLYARSKKIRD